MIKPPEIERIRLQEDPRLLWKTFTGFISRADTREMDDVQMAAQLPYWYDSEVRRGGHFGYFENGYQRLEDKLNVLVLASLDALKLIGAHQQAEILARAADVYFCKERRHPKDPDELKYLALQDEFSEFDRGYQQASPEIRRLLEKYLMAHLDHFVRII